MSQVSDLLPSYVLDLLVAAKGVITPVIGAPAGWYSAASEQLHTAVVRFEAKMPTLPDPIDERLWPVVVDLSPAHIDALTRSAQLRGLSFSDEVSRRLAGFDGDDPLEDRMRNLMAQWQQSGRPHGTS